MKALFVSVAVVAALFVLAIVIGVIVGIFGGWQLGLLVGVIMWGAGWLFAIVNCCVAFLRFME